MRSLPIVLCVLALSLPAPAAAYHIEDSLRGGTTFGHPVGGAFGPEGWTVTDRTDRIWFEIPRLGSGSIEFTVANVTLDNLVVEDNEMFAMYEAGYGMTEPIAYSPDFRNNHYKILMRVYGTDEAGRAGMQKLMWGMCPSGAPGYDACGCGSFFEEPFGGDPTWDGTPQRFRIEWGSGVSRLLRNGVEVVRIDWSDSGVSFGPSDLHFSLGTSRPDAVGSAALPIGAVFSDLVVDGVEGPLATCGGPIETPDAGMPLPDAGTTACDAERPIRFVELQPTGGRGRQGVLTARYRHCSGAGSFRIAQLTVGDAVDAPDAVAVAYEGGRFFTGSESCAPGEARRIAANASGSLDCALSSVVDEGTDRVVRWAFDFDPDAFAGLHEVFVDAKGGPAPEPRLGWTTVGTFTVTDEVPPPGPDTGTSGGDAGTRVREHDALIGGCSAAGERGAGVVPALVALALIVRRRRR